MPLLGKALCDGGLPCAEVTFRMAAARQTIAAISRELPDMLVGAGTVLTIQQVDEAPEAGAKFIVSPGLNPKIVQYCQSKSEIEQALSLGLDVVKFFPSEQNGGINKIKVLAGPYTNLKFMPTGGVNAFAALLGVGARKTSKGYFAGTLIEVMAEKHKGEYGHIAIGVNHFDRAVAYLERKGYKFDESSVTHNGKGQRTFGYLSTEIGGFALHLNQK